MCLKILVRNVPKITLVNRRSLCTRVLNLVSSTFVILLTALYSCNLTASEGIGDVAANIYEPVSVIITLARAVSFISGSGLILGGILKYFEYRRNPVAVRLSTVIFMCLFGIALVLVGMLPMTVDTLF